MSKSQGYEILFQPTITGAPIVLSCDSMGHADKAASLIAMSFSGDVVVREKNSHKRVSTHTGNNT